MAGRKDSPRFEVTLPGGKAAWVKKRGATWYMDYWDGSQRKRPSLHTRDKGVATERAREKLLKAERRAAGRVDPFEEHHETPLGDHVQAFEVSGFRGKTKPERREEVMRSLRAFLSSPVPGSSPTCRRRQASAGSPRRKRSRR